MPNRQENPPERNLGPQPVADIMDRLELKASDLVAASTEHLTHKMVARARKGRRLTRNVQHKLLRALNRASDQTFELRDLFNYGPGAA